MVPSPSTRSGTAVNEAPVGGSCPRPVRCSTTGTPAASRSAAGARSRLPGTLAGPRYGSVMIDHLGVQVADVAASLAFYLHAFEPLGMPEALRIPDEDSFVV